MLSSSKLLLAAAATAAIFTAGTQSAEAGRLRFLHFPHVFTPDYAYDPYVDDPAYDDGDMAYADPADEYDDPDTYYVPRHHKRRIVIEQDPNPWWMEAPQPRKLNSARALEPVPDSKPARRKPVVASVPAPKPTPSPFKSKPATVKPKLETASLTPVAPKAKPAAAPKTTASKTIGCTAGAAIVTGYGFANVTPKACTGSIYAYNAQRDGKPYVIKLTAAQGEITEVTKQ